MIGLKSCVSEGAIIGAAIFKNLALIWSDPVDLDISLMNMLTIDKITSYIGNREMLVVKISLGHRF